MTEHVKQDTGDADMLIVKETLLKAEEFGSIVVHSKDTESNGRKILPGHLVDWFY